MAGKVRLKQLAQDGATNGQVCTFNALSGLWEPQTPASGSSGFPVVGDGPGLNVRDPFLDDRSANFVSTGASGWENVGDPLYVLNQNQALQATAIVSAKGVISYSNAGSGASNSAFRLISEWGLGLFSIEQPLVPAQGSGNASIRFFADSSVANFVSLYLQVNEGGSAGETVAVAAIVEVEAANSGPIV